MHSVPLPSDLIGPNQAAEILHVGRATVYRMIERGELTGYRVSRGLTRVSESEVRDRIEITSPAGRPDLDGYIQRIVNAAPALTPEQLEKLRALLAPAQAA